MTTGGFAWLKWGLSSQSKTNNILLICKLLMISYQPEWRKEDEERGLRMERLYILDGRHRPDHKLRGLYTGLNAKGEELENYIAS
tara:strand:- start:234 stop:488 length:255 start_codon:yes stop_codon:yes gene_type:complete